MTLPNLPLCVPQKLPSQFFISCFLCFFLLETRIVMFYASTAAKLSMYRRPHAFVKVGNICELRYGKQYDAFKLTSTAKCSRHAR